MCTNSCMSENNIEKMHFLLLFFNKDIEFTTQRRILKLEIGPMHNAGKSVSEFVFSS